MIQINYSFVFFATITIATTIYTMRKFRSQYKKDIKNPLKSETEILQQETFRSSQQVEIPDSSKNKTETQLRVETKTRKKVYFEFETKTQHHIEHKTRNQIHSLLRDWKGNRMQIIPMNQKDNLDTNRIIMSFKKDASIEEQQKIINKYRLSHMIHESYEIVSFHTDYDISVVVFELNNFHRELFNYDVHDDLSFNRDFN
jgi:hypothetical protein